MKVSFILPGGGRSGGVKSTVKAANGLLQRSHEIRLLVYKDRESVRSKVRNLWLNFHYPDGNDWLDLFKGKVERFTHIKRCAFEDNEIVVASGWWAGREIRQVRHPGIIKVHHIRGMLRDPNQMRAAWSEDVPKIVVSSYLTDVIERTCGQKVYAIIPNGIDTVEYYPSVLENERNGVGTIFGIGYHKDPETVLGVLKMLKQRCKAVPQRVFSAYRRPKEISRNAYYRLPSLPKIREIYSRSLVWILGSFSEGFPAPPLEAMACGCAVVATDCGGTRDFIKDGENGFLVQIGNVEQIVSKVKLLLDNAELRQQFTWNSKDTVSNYSWENSVDKMEEVLLKVC